MDDGSEEEDDPLRLPEIKRFDSHSERKKKVNKFETFTCKKISYPRQAKND
jgi:hypothetical protein